MVGTIALNGHISQLRTNFVHKICKPLFRATPVRYFCYLRRYRDGRFTFLPSKIDLGSYFFEDGVYPDTWFAGLPFDELKSGYSFWDIAKQVSSEETNHIAQELAGSFGLSFGVEILEKYDDYCDFYSFSGGDPEIYFMSLGVLQRFIFYFRQHCRNVMFDAYQDSLLLEYGQFDLPAIPIMDVGGAQSHDANSDFKVTRYFLEGKYEGVYLTRREVDLLHHLEKGETVKCIAEQLSISPRTLEHHVTNIKDKLGVKRMAEALFIARANKVLD